MKRVTYVAGIMLLLPAFVLAGVGIGAGSPSEVVAPDGVFVLSSVQVRSCIAVKVPLMATQALGGIRWYNNDDQTVFPKILVAPGYTDYPPLYEDGVVVASNVVGGEAAWSEVQFAEPVASATGILYVIFQFLDNEQGEKMGVGPAIGYMVVEKPSCVFLSLDGDNWSRLVTDYQLLVDPVYIVREPGTAVMSCSQPDPEALLTLAEDMETPVVYRDEFFNPYPNPFNPTTTLAFTLRNAGPVELVVFDIRGQQVAEIHSGHLAAGHHEFLWYGQDSRGRRVGSGVYLARLRIPSGLKVQRMLLLK